jgi:hypothetical protein
VKIIHTNTTTVYTRTFGGFAFSWTVRHEIDHLAHALKEAGVCPFKGKFFVATYDGPWKWFGRTNEVWWVKFPKHHHNKTEPEGPPAEPKEAGIGGLEIVDPFMLFPEEFPPPPEKPEGPEGPEGFEKPNPEEDELAWKIANGDLIDPEITEEFEKLMAEAQAQSEDVVDAIVNVA